MKRKDFVDKMGFAKSQIPTQGVFGSCGIIEDYIGPDAKDEYSYMFSFRILHMYSYWLGSQYIESQKDGMTDQERRLLFLDAFEGYCLSEKLYKEW